MQRNHIGKHQSEIALLIPDQSDQSLRVYRKFLVRIRAPKVIPIFFVRCDDFDIFSGHNMVIEFPVWRPAVQERSWAFNSNPFVLASEAV